MSIYVQLSIIIFTFISGVAAIVLSNQIMRKYRLPYLSSYFYFLIFFFIFGVYTIIGSQSILFILEQQGANIESTQSIEAILIAMGIPFLILAWYMFLRLSREFFKQSIPSFFVIIYFLLFAVSFITYALLNLNIGGLETINFFLDKQSLIWTFTSLMTLVFIYSVLSIYFRSRNLRDIFQRKAYLWFSLWYFIILLGSMICLHFNEVHIIFGLLFIAILFGFHIIPVLFLSIYLQKYYVAEAALDIIQDKMEETIRKYDISKREAEVVELICKGMSNQEISDSLYISLQTVKDHVHRIFIKTGVKSRIQLSNLMGR